MASPPTLSPTSPACPLGDSASDSDVASAADSRNAAASVSDVPTDSAPPDSSDAAGNQDSHDSAEDCVGFVVSLDALEPVFPSLPRSILARNTKGCWIGNVWGSMVSLHTAKQVKNWSCVRWTPRSSATKL